MSNSSDNEGNPWFGAGTAIMEEAANNFKRMARIPSLWQRAQRVKRGATPSEIAYEEDRLKLLHYISDEPPKHRTPVLFVFGLGTKSFEFRLLIK